MIRGRDDVLICLRERTVGRRREPASEQAASSGPLHPRNGRNQFLRTSTPKLGPNIIHLNPYAAGSPIPMYTKLLATVLASRASGHHLDTHTLFKSHIRTPKISYEEFLKMLILKQILKYFYLNLTLKTLHKDIKALLALFVYGGNLNICCHLP